MLKNDRSTNSSLVEMTIAHDGYLAIDLAREKFIQNRPNVCKSKRLTGKMDPYACSNKETLSSIRIST